MAKHRYEVTGPLAVGDVEPGGTVTLDDDEVNIAALVEAGHVKPLSDAAKQAVKDK